ncbi:MAG TPA: DUF5694 domain-containing protein [Luteibacter sp.]|uniref:DUF5694 domain-containing protein n=1 Tax=Luteibacter sp. TaxID=1886636 RepID=UPI002CB4011B|nr:DUF5694 domain-containing protein [Luteibacter sp.]HVI55719.1 DUF5694 domain-containing protein [Luteibacter sp.]
MLKRLLLCQLLLLVAMPAVAQTSARLPALNVPDAAPATRILVLGTVHLRGAPKGFKVDSLNPVIDRLAVFQPTVITVESTSGEMCDLMARHPAVYDPVDVKEHYCRDASHARTAAGLDLTAALAEMRHSLSHWPDHPTASQRRRLAAVFLAAGDSTSATVQWLQLAVPERRAGDGLDNELVAALDRLATGTNSENYQIAARLAARLGLQRVFPVDDHANDGIDVGDQEAYGKAVSAQWAIAAPRRKTMDDEQDALLKRGEMLSLYRLINRPESTLLASRTDFGAALADPSLEHYGQRYVAGWEVRNLIIAANIRIASGATPGARVLAIIGATHKPWLDGLLGQMQGVQIVDAEQVLR